MKFYLHKIGGHLQELAVLMIVFVPLDRHLTMRQIAELADLRCYDALGYRVGEENSLMAAFGAYGPIMAGAIVVGIVCVILTRFVKDDR